MTVDQGQYPVKPWQVMSGFKTTMYHLFGNSHFVEDAAVQLLNYLAGANSQEWICLSEKTLAMAGLGEARIIEKLLQTEGEKALIVRISSGSSVYRVTPFFVQSFYSYCPAD